MLNPNLTRILLVHGALADGSWSKVIPFLQGAGYSVTAAQQPLTSIPNDIAVVKNGIATLNQQSSDPILVVGHSFGGLVITNAAKDAANVEGLVYVQAFAPDEGETVAELTAPYPLPSKQRFVPEADGRLVLPQPDFLQYFAPDVPQRKGKLLSTVQGPFDPQRFEYVSGPPAWKDIKNLHYIVGSADQIISPDLEAYFAKRMGAKTTVLKGASHVGLISHAEEVARVIIEAARQINIH